MDFLYSLLFIAVRSTPSRSWKPFSLLITFLMVSFFHYFLSFTRFNLSMTSRYLNNNLTDLEYFLMNKFLDGSKNQLLIKLVFSWVNNEFYFPIFPKTYPLSSNYCNIIHFDLMVTCNKISSGLEAADAERRRGRRDVGGGRRPVGHRQRRRRRQGDDHRRILHRRRRSGGSPSFPLLWFVFFFVPIFVSFFYQTCSTSNTKRIVHHDVIRRGLVPMVHLWWRSSPTSSFVKILDSRWVLFFTLPGTLLGFPRNCSFNVSLRFERVLSCFFSENH